MEDLSRRFKRQVEANPTILDDAETSKLRSLEKKRVSEIKERERIARALANQQAFEKGIINKITEISRLVFYSKVNISGWKDAEQVDDDSSEGSTKPGNIRRIINKRRLSFGVDGTSVSDVITVDISTRDFSESKKGIIHYNMIANIKEYFGSMHGSYGRVFRLPLGEEDPENEVEKVMSIVRENLNNSVDK